MNENWTRWIIASVRKHFDSNKKDYTLFIEGQKRDIEKDVWAELRWNGPFFRQQTKKDWQLDLVISILISSELSNDLDQINKIQGVFQVAFMPTIIIYKFGDGPDDDASILGCLLLSDEGSDTILTNNFGQRGPDLRIMQSEITAVYKMDLTA